ncbi:hypothetical protein KBD61_04120 [Patescibacteria group bacterium]|nr:hypothetical protein [Patescibacteria group bacterium]MBP9710183.1 hypothetical protein [Patescibacteria group bacterium]
MLHLLRKKKVSPSKHHHPIDYLAEANAIFNGLALYPQLITAWRTRDVNALSPTTFAILLLANIVWVMYGIHRKDTAILVCSALVITSSSCLLVLTLLWRN